MAAELVVMGLGHVGLPLSRAAVSAGLATAGYDVSRPVVDGLAEGRSHVGGVDDADVAAMLRAGFHATDDPAVLEGAQTVVICVPTGLTDKGLPDLSAVEDATAAVAARLHPGTLVVLESTSYPGTTEDVVRPLLERGSGLRAGEDFHLAYSPQRIDPGNPTWDVRNTPKIVSGRTALCAKHAVAFYSRFVDQLVVARGTREAEMAKLLENTYRYVNIALVDEVALFCHETGIDIWDVLHCAASKPFGFAPFSPGPGVGGHCIPVDPRYLAARAESQGFAFRTLAAAQDVLSRMPDHVVDRALTILTETAGRPEGARALLLGVTYKPDVADIRETPARQVAAGLLAAGVEVSYHDPYVPEFTVGGTPLPRTENLRDALDRVDVAILLQDHACYARETLGQARCALLDTRGKAVGRRVTLL
ncbi:MULTISPECIES: nucleotide sugar dehydrogenase [unclassified Streptomyces]|uniref:nucleotide sugar dehydrogenase n=1 Tax=unclassified Streptomyces TaxID=2593676 RepID=UPI000DBA5907|nr:nucleotide sugar dehydrogenase [Streptomyces sp. PsTaAH-130]MYU05762.1 nucleotide sugar dehydrogenase [Streptomyces sp. SID8366]MYU65410.1 nucleotide sugar dehydrogenase [Streptomyces sp. SID69]RAJ63811.1 nucleotide sugar dehydrogenase [Streptomyces sp. PsTaAH-130]